MEVSSRHDRDHDRVACGCKRKTCRMIGRVNVFLWIVIPVVIFCISCILGTNVNATKLVSFSLTIVLMRLRSDSGSCRRLAGN
jgi:hypothetical protein